MSYLSRETDEQIGERIQSILNGNHPAYGGPSANHPGLDFLRQELARREKERERYAQARAAAPMKCPNPDCDGILELQSIDENGLTTHWSCSRRSLFHQVHVKGTLGR